MIIMQGLLQPSVKAGNWYPAQAQWQAREVACANSSSLLTARQVCARLAQLAAKRHSLLQSCHIIASKLAKASWFPIPRARRCGADAVVLQSMHALPLCQPGWPTEPSPIASFDWDGLIPPPPSPSPPAPLPPALAPSMHAPSFFVPLLCMPYFRSHIHAAVSALTPNHVY